MRFIPMLSSFLIFSNAICAQDLKPGETRQQLSYSNPGYGYLQPTYFVDDEHWNAIKAIISSKEGDQIGAHKIFEIFCDGTNPRFNIKRTFRFKPKLENRMPVDKANDEINRQMEMAPYYFQNDFFYLSGDGKNLSEYLLKHSFADVDNDPTSPKYVGSSDYEYFGHKNTVRATDMYILMHLFTFRLSQTSINEMYGNAGDDFRIKKFGYAKGGEFRASEAISFKDYIWRYVLIHDTELKEAPQDDGTIAFEITWIPDIFCKYGIAIDDLKY